MEKEEFKRRAYILGKNHSLDILHLLQSRSWTKASDISKELELHTATCSSYLEELWEIDILERRESQGKTRKVVEYRVKDPFIRMVYDLSQDEGGEDDELEFYKELFESILKRAEQLYGMGELGMDDFLEDKEENKEDLILAIRELLDYNEKRIGTKSTDQLIRRSGRRPVREHKELLRKEDLLDSLPSRFSDILKEVD